MSDKEVVEEYIALIRQYTDRDAEAEEFSRMYLNTFKNEHRAYSEETYHILQNMFWAADAYCGDPELRNEDDIDEEEFSDVARQTLKKLNKRTE